MISYQTACNYLTGLSAICLGSAVLAAIPVPGLAVWLAGTSITMIIGMVLGPTVVLLLLLLLRGILRGLEHVLTGAIERLDRWIEHTPEQQDDPKERQPPDLDTDTGPLTDFQRQGHR